MKKWNICAWAVILTVLISHKAVAQKLTLLKTTHFSHFPSASALEFFNGQLFVFGDDATQLLILDSNHHTTDSIQLFKANKKRIEKDDKADIEAATIVRHKNENYLVALSSFSTPQRNRVFVFPLSNLHQYKNEKVTQAASFVKKTGIKEPNIEGAALAGKWVVISNRANLTHTINHLLVAEWNEKNWMKQMPRMITLQLPKQKSVLGVSGLAYVPEKDLLLFTASTEQTTSAFTDGAIGESYLGYITGATKKLEQKIISPDELINLSSSLRIGKEKIESVCIEAVNGNTLLLHLAADNDNGESTLYKLQLKL